MSWGRHEVLIADLFGAHQSAHDPLRPGNWASVAAAQLVGGVLVHLDRPATIEVLLPRPAVALGGTATRGGLTQGALQVRLVSRSESGPAVVAERNSGLRAIDASSVERLARSVSVW